MKIVIASKNPVKINSTEQGFHRMFPLENFEIESVSVPSNVSAQPFSDEETYKGAFNRANNAKDISPDSDFWVGIEGGIEQKNDDMEVFAWIVIIDKHGKIGKGRTGTFFLPKQIADLVNSGKELGEADDIVFSRSNSKQTNGAVGILTGDIIDRTKYYLDAVIFALIPFRNPELY